MTTHQEARALLVDAFAKLQPDRVCSPQLLQLIAGVAWHETNYGAGWGGAMRGSRNQGAMQCNHCQDANGQCGPGCRPATDSHSNGKKYGGCFREYPTDTAAWLDFAKWFATKPEILDAADGSLTYEFALAMRKRSYFEARGSTRENEAAYYAIPLQHACELIAASFDEPLATTLYIPDDVSPGK